MQDFRAKLSDFGFARDGPDGDKSHVTTEHILGTKGYVAPEYVMTGNLHQLRSYFLMLLMNFGGNQFKNCPCILTCLTINCLRSSNNYERRVQFWSSAVRVINR